MRSLPAFRTGVGTVLCGPGAASDPVRDSRSAALAAWSRRLPEARLAALIWDGDVPEGAAPDWAAPPWSTPDLSRPDVSSPDVPAPERATQLAAPAASTGPGVTDLRRLCFAAVGVRLAVTVTRLSPRALTGRLWAAGPVGTSRLLLQGPQVDVGVVTPGMDGVLPRSVVPRGPVRLVLRRPELPVVATTWVLLD